MYYMLYIVYAQWFLLSIASSIFFEYVCDTAPTNVDTDCHVCIFFYRPPALARLDFHVYVYRLMASTQTLNRSFFFIFFVIIAISYEFASVEQKTYFTHAFLCGNF